MAEKKNKNKKFISPKEMRDKLDNISEEDVPNKVKCNANLSKCKNCGYKFKKNEDTCAQCLSKRNKCDKWALKGTKKCKLHGGAGGRNIEVDDEGIPLHYDQDQERQLKKIRLIKFYDQIESVGERVMTTLNLIEETLKIGSDGNDQYDLDSLDTLFKRSMEMFKQMISYGKMINGDKNDKTITLKVKAEVMLILKTTIMSRSFAIAANNILDILRKNFNNEETVQKLFNQLIEPIKKAHREQDTIFSESEIIAKKYFPDFVEEEEEDGGNQTIHS